MPTDNNQLDNERAIGTMNTFLLIQLLCCGIGIIASTDSVQTANDWNDIKVRGDPCTPNPCAKKEVCKVNELTLQPYCDSLQSQRKDLLLMCFKECYRALPSLRKMPEENLSKCSYKQSLADPCSSNPCQNGGKCFSNRETQDYHCECADTHVGRSCETASFSERIRIDHQGLPTLQSSILNPLYTADKAIDNNPNTFSHTNVGDSNPWWQIDLQDSYKVIGINIVNRIHFCGWRLHDFEVRVGDHDIASGDVQLNTLCDFHEGGDIEAGASLKMYCKSDKAIGRYLSIQIVRPCGAVNLRDCLRNGNILTIADLRIYGYAQ